MQVTMRANCWDGVRRQSFFADDEMVYCKKHNQWYYCDDEMYCCAQELEGQLIQQEESSISERLKRGMKRLNDPKLRAILGYAIPIALLLHGLPPVGASRFSGDVIMAMAAPGSLKDKVLHAFDPLINLIQSLAYPIAGVMIAGGCLFIMVGNRERGMQMLQNAAIGYILVQLAPLLLKILVGVGSGI